MLVSFIILVYVFVMTALSGVASYALFTKLFRFKFNLPELPILIIVGLCFDACWLQLFHVFHAMDGWAHFSLIGIIVVLFSINKTRVLEWWQHTQQDWSFSKSQFGFLVILIIAALLNIFARAGIGDIGDYHLQAIQWDEKYPIVHGLGNLRRQLGNNSNWFLLHAFFGFGFLGLKSVYTLNAFLLIVAGMYFMHKQTDEQPISKGIIFFYILLMAFRKYVGAVTNDYVTTIFTLMLFTEWTKSKYEHVKQFLPLLFVVMVMPTLKLSSIAMLAIVPLFVFQFRKYQSLGLLMLLLCAMGLLIYMPWLYTNYWQSGYLIYPIDAIDLFDVDWKMNASVLQYERVINIANERVPGVAIEEVMQMPFSIWFFKWLKHLDVFSLALLFSFVAGVFIMMISSIRTHLKTAIINSLKHQSTWILIATIFIAMPIWFLNAPATRFVFGYLVFFMAWCAQFLWSQFKSDKSNMNRNWVLWIAVLLLLVNGLFFLKTDLTKDEMKSSWIIPLPYSSAATHQVPLSQGFVNMPEEGQQCWDAPIPCTSILDSSLQWRTERLADGFRLR